MADNVTLNAASGTFAASADDCGADGLVQRIKLSISADGDATPIPADANGLLVNLGANNDVVISDGGGSITVDGVVGAAIADGSGNSLTSAARGSERALSVQVVDITGGQITDFKSVQYAEDAPHTTGDMGTMMLAVRQDSASTSLVGTNLDYAPLQVNNIGELRVVLPTSTSITSITGSMVPGTSAGQLGKAEDAVAGNGDTGVFALAVRRDTPSSGAGASGDYASLNVDANGSLYVTPQPASVGGLTTFRSLDLDETEEEVKATAGQVYGVWFTNRATATRYLKFYDATAASVTVGTTTPLLTIALPGNASDDITGLFASAMGIAFSTAITVAATTGFADNDTGAPDANDVIVNIFYK